MNEMTLKLVEQLTQKLGATSEHVWEVLIRQAMISAVTDTIIMLIMIVCSWKALIKAKALIRVLIDDDLAVVLWLVLGIAMAIPLIVLIALFKSAIAAAMNPEYWALQHLLAL